MGFNPAGGALSGATDVALSNPATDQVLSYDGSVAKWRNDSANRPVAFSTKTSSYTLALVDAYTVVEINSASATTVTIPTNASVAFPVGTLIELYQYGTGQVTITGASGVTLRSPGGRLKTAEQYATATLRKRATNEWAVDGNIEV